MDGVSAAAAVAQFAAVAVKVVWELKSFVAATAIIQEVIDGLIKEVQGLSIVLDSMRKTLKHIGANNAAAELDSYWTSVNHALQDGSKVLAELRDTLAVIDRPGKVWERGVKKIRFESAKYRIDSYRQQVQSYKDILYLCLQTIIFWNQVVCKESTDTFIVNLAELHKSVHRNAKQMNEKLDSLRNLAISPPEAAQVAAMGRLRECVKSVAGIVTTASTIVSHDRESTLLPSEFELYFREEYDGRLKDWIDAQTMSRLDEAVPDSRPTAVAADLDDCSDTSDAESDSDIEFDLNRGILDKCVQLLSEDKISAAEKLLQGRLADLEIRHSGAPPQIKHPYLYREIQLTLASLLLTKGDFKTANHRAQAAYKGFKQLGDVDQELACLQLLARIAKAKGSEIYYDGYTQLCANLESAKGGLTQDAMTTSLSVSRLPQIPEDIECQDHPVVDGSSTPELLNVATQTLRTVASRTSLGLVSEITTGVYEDAQEFWGRDPAVAVPEATNSPDPVARQLSVGTPRQQSAAGAAGWTHGSSPTNLSPQSSIDLQSEMSTTATEPTDFNNVSAFHSQQAQRKSVADRSVTYPRSMSVADGAMLNKALGPSLGDNFLRRSTHHVDPMLKNSLSADVASNTLTVVQSDVRSSQGKSRKAPEQAPGGAWSRSGLSSRSKAGPTRRSDWTKKIRSLSGSLEMSSLKGGEDKLPSPYEGLSPTKTDTSIEKNWVQVARPDTAAISPTNFSSPLHSMSPMMGKRRVVCVGDSAVGKTSLAVRYRDATWVDVLGQGKTTKSSPTLKQTHPSLSAPYGKPTINPRDRMPLEVTVWDTPGQHGGYELHRIPAYQDASVVLVCFAIDDRNSLENVEKIWQPELQAHCPGVPIILVSCKFDVDHKGIITAGEAEAVRHRIGAMIYLECSALSGHGVQKLFNFAAMAQCASDNPRARNRDKRASKGKMRQGSGQENFNPAPYERPRSGPSAIESGTDGGSSWPIPA